MPKALLQYAQMRFESFTAIYSPFREFHYLIFTILGHKILLLGSIRKIIFYFYVGRKPNLIRNYAIIHFSAYGHFTIVLSWQSVQLRSPWHITVSDWQRAFRPFGPNLEDGIFHRHSVFYRMIEDHKTFYFLQH